MSFGRLPTGAIRVLCATAVAVGLLSGLAACSGSNDANPTADPIQGDTTASSLPVVEEVPQLVASLHLQLPLDDYLPSIEDLGRTGLARRELMSQCLLRYGIDVALPEPVSGVGLRTWTERRYGLSDARLAAKLGYGLGKRDPKAEGNTPEDPDLSPRALAVLTGEGDALPSGQQVPTGGCSGEAQRTLAGEVPEGAPVDALLAQQLSQESFERSQQDPRVLDAFALWSDCMSRHGHEYADPLAPFSDPQLGDGSTPAAVATAVDDVACKASTNVIGVWYAVESAYQQVSIEENRAGLETLAAANAMTEQVVAQVLSDS